MSLSVCVWSDKVVGAEDMAHSRGEGGSKPSPNPSGSTGQAASNQMDLAHTNRTGTHTE